MNNQIDDRIPAALVDAGGTKTSYATGAEILRQGDVAECLYYVITGKVQISVTSKHGKEGLIGPPLGRGDFVGESCLSSQNAYLSSAHTTAPSEIIKISCPRMVKILKTDSAINHAFSDFLLRHGLNIEAKLDLFARRPNDRKAEGYQQPHQGNRQKALPGSVISCEIPSKKDEQNQSAKESQCWSHVSLLPRW